MACATGRASTKNCPGWRSRSPAREVFQQPRDELQGDGVVLQQLDDALGLTNDLTIRHWDQRYDAIGRYVKDVSCWPLRRHGDDER